VTFADLYARTLWRQPFRVCGEVLMPLTIGHARVLDAFGFWDPATWIELMTSVWICGRPCREFRMPTGWWEAFKWRVRLLRLSSEFFPLHRAAWRQYIDVHLSVPVVTWQGNGKMPGTPAFHGLRLSLIRLGYAPETVDDVPVDQAFLDHYGAMESEGRLEIASYSQEELDARFQEARHYVQSLGKN